MTPIINRLSSTLVSLTPNQIRLILLLISLALFLLGAGAPESSGNPGG